MKKSIISVIATSLVITLAFTNSTPSIEGRAQVAQEGELPQGMYIKANTFLPGDSVIITNPSTKVSVEALVFETIDVGLAAIISDEVAEKLFITSNSDSIVQIRKVVAQATIPEYPVYSTPTIEDIALDDSQIFIEAEPITEEEALTVEGIDTVQEEIEDEIFEDSVPEITYTLVDEAEEVAEESVYTPFSDMNSLFLDTDSLVSQPTQDEAITATEDDYYGIFDEPEVTFEPEFYVEPEEIVEETTLVEPEVIEPIVVIQEEEPVLEDEVIKETPIVEPIVPEVVVVEPIVEEESTTEVYDIYAYTPATEPIEEDIIDKTPIFTGNFQDYIVDSIEAKNGKNYYVQLATYKDSKNIESVLSQYADNYPFYLVKSDVIAGAYQVVIGPLTKDEYTVVLERFKSYGYTDAFLRIAN